MSSHALLLHLLPYLLQAQQEEVSPRVGGRITAGSTAPMPQQVQADQQQQQAPQMSDEDAYRQMFPQGYYRDLFGIHGIGDPGGGDLPSWPIDIGGPTGGGTPQYFPPVGTIDWRRLLGGG